MPKGIYFHRPLSEETKKKMSASRIGHIVTSVTRMKIREKHLGMKHSEESKNKIKEKRLKQIMPSVSPLKGRELREDHKKKISIAGQGRVVKLETREKIRLSKLGKFGPLSNAWKGGSKAQYYPPIFNESLKETIRQRDGLTCQLCGKSQEEELKNLGQRLSINHIDFDKKNCNEENLNTLCCSCNAKINGNRKFYTEFFQQFQTCKL